MITITAPTQQLENLRLGLASSFDMTKNYAKRNNMDVTATLTVLKQLSAAVEHSINAPLPFGDGYKESLDELDRLQEQIQSENTIITVEKL